jgi:glutaredoxin
LPDRSRPIFTVIVNQIIFIMQKLSLFIGGSALTMVLAGAGTAFSGMEVAGATLREPARASNLANTIAVEAISTQSGAAEIALAEHLTKTGVKMYGAHWCKYCHKQKQAFGATAWPKITYIECANGGQNYNPSACQKAGIKAYPTWEIKGKQYAGTMSLFKLAKYSGYTGATNFQNARAL